MATAPITVRPTIKTSKELGTTNLFRFINYSDPDKTVASKNSKYSFLQNPNQSSSPFMTAIEGTTSSQNRKAAISTTATSFTSMKSSRDIIAVNEKLYEFGEILKKFSSDTTQEELSKLTNSVELLTSQQQDLLWDNLYFQAIKKKSNLVTDAIIRLLRSNAFLKEYKNQAEQNEALEEVHKNDAELLKNNIDILQRIACANVMIPTELVAKEKVQNNGNQPEFDAYTKDALLKKSKADIARYKITKLNELLNEVELADQKNHEENAILYKTAYDTYLETVSAIQPITVEHIDAEGIASNIQSMPSIPVFDFKNNSLFRSEFIGNNISDDAKKLLDTIKPSSSTSFIDFTEKVKKLIKEQYNLMYKNADETEGKIVIGDISIPVTNRIKKDSIIVSSEKLVGSNNLYSIFVTHYFDNPDLASIEVTIETQDAANETVTSFSDSPIYKSKDHVTYQLFSEGLSLKNDGYNFSLNFLLIDDTQTDNIPVVFTKMNKPSYARLSANGIAQKSSFDDNEPGNENVHLYGVKRVGILEYKRVEQKICCYVAGEVSHIENIMAREYKEKVSRDLTRSEIVQEDSKERESENLKDTTSTDRHEMHSEVSQVLQEEQSRQIGVNAGGSVKYEPTAKLGINVFANTNMNFSNSSSANTSFSASESFAKEVVERALNRVVEKVSSKRTSRMLREYEETNKHGFDNREGDKHVTGVYRWVDKIYENTLMNYGKRLLYDFMIPEPSKNFKSWMKNNTSPKQGYLPRKPKELSVFGIEDKDDKKAWENTNESNYALAAAEYGADVEPCPVSFIAIGKSFSDNPKEKVAKWDESKGSSNFEIEIPDGYTCKNFWGTYSHVFSYSGSEGSEATILIDTQSFWFARQNSQARYKMCINNWMSNDNRWLNTAKKLPISVSTFNVGGFSLNVTAGCYRTDDAYHTWQQETYRAIMDAYYKRLDEYNNAESANNAQNTSTNVDYNYNTYKGRYIEQRELKRACIELILAPFGKEIGKDNYKTANSNKNFHIDQTAGFETHAKYVKFLEEAFNWDLMSYYFYPYYWGSEADWSKLVRESGTADELFMAFLQSGMARVTVPVRPKYEYAVVYLMNTGDITPFNSITDDGINKDLYMSIADLLKFEEGTPEATWHIRVPSDLVIIQNDSSALDEEGLPCEVKRDEKGQIMYGKDGKPLYCENGEPIATGKSLLGKQTVSTEEGVGSWTVNPDDENQTPPIVVPPQTASN